MGKSGRAKRWLLWGLISLGALLLVKRFLADIRYIPSASMTPTLMPGDVVLIDKAFGASGELARYDIVMFERPQLGSQFLKRVVGLPGESVQLVGGDLFIDGRISPKAPSEFLRMAAPIFDSRSEPWERSWEFRKGQVRQAEGGGIILDGSPGPSGAAGLFRKIPYLLEINPKSLPKSASSVAHDAGMRIDFQAPAAGEFQAVLGEQGDLFHFRLKFGALALSASVLRESIGPAEAQIRAELPPIEPGSRHCLEFGNVDNRLFLHLDGKEMFSTIPYDRNTPHRQQEAQEERAPTSPVTLSFEGGNFEILRLMLLRDVDYTDLGGIGVEAPYELGPEEYFLLGDNSGESEDSRSFGRVLRREIQGKGWRVLLPISRTCRL